MSLWVGLPSISRHAWPDNFRVTCLIHNKMIGQKWLKKMELSKLRRYKKEKEEIRYESKIDGILMKYAWVCNDVSKTIKRRAHQITTHRWTHVLCDNDHNKITN